MLDGEEKSDEEMEEMTGDELAAHQQRQSDANEKVTVPKKKVRKVLKNTAAK